MQKLVMMLVAANLLVCSAPYARPDPLQVATNQGATMTDQLEGAKMGEENGDLARIHKNYGLAISSYRAALNVNRKNAVLYDKIGIAELLMGARGQRANTLPRRSSTTPITLPPSITWE